LVRFDRSYSENLAHLKGKVYWLQSGTHRKTMD